MLYIHNTNVNLLLQNKHKFDAFETKTISESISVNSPGTIKKHVATYSLSLKPDEELKNTRKLNNHDTHCLMKMMMMIIIMMMMMMMLMVVVVVAMRMIHPDGF